MAQKKNKVSKPLTKKQKTKFAAIWWTLVGLGIGAIVMLFVAISNGWIGYLPPIDELQNPKNKYATEIISCDGERIGSFFISTDNRIHTAYNELSPYVVHALIATEDARFEKHNGIDFRALGRVLVKSLIFRHSHSGGGSTLTQQLAKQLYSPSASNKLERACQKFVEWVIAAKLERLYSKEEIITMYLDHFDFLNNAVGIKTASWVYFGVTPDKLTIEQAATLVGMCKNPSLYNPASQRRKDNCKARRNVVLSQMKKGGYITAQECDSLQQLDLVLNYHRVDHKLGLAPYFREYLRKCLTAKEPVRKNYASWQLAPYGQFYMDSIEWADNPLYGFIEKNPKSDGTKYDLYRDGLKIYTTIDSRMQRYAEEAVLEYMKDLQERFFKSIQNNKKAPYASNIPENEVASHLKKAMKQSDRYRWLQNKGLSESEIEKSFNTPTDMMIFSYNGAIDTTMTPLDSIKYHKAVARCGVVSIDPMSGQVKAYIGGPDFTYFQYDMASQGRRQVGSTVKPYLYSLAMSEGWWPCDTAPNRPITLYDDLGREFKPRNSSKSRVGETVTLKWGLQNSNNWISAWLMDKLKPEQLINLMRSMGIKGELVPVISLCLGPCEVTVLEMADAYTSFPNKGIRTEPIFVTRIEDNLGNTIAEFTPKTEEVFNEETSYKMLDMLQAVANGGTGSRIRSRHNIHAQMGCKTGTTNDNADGWFMGFTPDLVTGIWVGWEERSIHFSNMADGQGAAMALPIWGIYMNKVYDDATLNYSKESTFDIPSDFDSNSGCR